MKNEQALEEWHQDTIDIVSDEIESLQELYKFFGQEDDKVPVALIEVVDERGLIPKFELA